MIYSSNPHNPKNNKCIVKYETRTRIAGLKDRYASPVAPTSLCYLEDEGKILSNVE